MKAQLPAPVVERLAELLAAAVVADVRGRLAEREESKSPEGSMAAESAR